MKVLFDTSILIAGTLSSHTHFQRAKPWFKKVVDKKIEMVVSAHSLAEYFSVVTKLPLSPRITPDIAIQLIEKSIRKYANTIHLSAKDVMSAINLVASLGLSGGIIYDALIYTAATKAKVDKILTFNVKHFQQLCLNNQKFIQAP